MYEVSQATAAQQIDILTVFLNSTVLIGQPTRCADSARAKNVWEGVWRYFARVCHEEEVRGDTYKC